MTSKMQWVNTYSISTIKTLEHSIYVILVFFLLTWTGICRTRKTFPNRYYLLKVNNVKIGAISEINSKLTIKTPEQCQWHRSGVFIVSFEQISHIALVFPLLTLNK